MIRKIFIFLIASTLSLTTSLEAAEKSFAIIVDGATYSACKGEIDGYKSMLDGEGLSAYVLAKEWKNPEQVKAELLSLYKSNGLEGAIFIGQIPIPMVRDAQHFTSAFKMDQEAFSMLEASVPSDRFYDDFDLKFDYLCQDSLKSLFYYYSLRWDSPQRIDCDIYTGRLKPTKQGEEGFQQIRDYFKKLFAERASSNKMDALVSYTGEGSFSNSLTAWKDDGVAMRDQFPQAFSNKNSAKFLLFYMYPYMKQTVIDEMRRDDVDLMLFHEHGMPFRQYLTAGPLSEDDDQYYETAKRLFRERLRKNGKESEKNAPLMKKWMESYHIDSTWFAGAFDKEQLRLDSLDEIRTGIVLEDVPGICPNPRVVVFDACYNGDFREESCIASEYIFAKGKTLVAFANSVNVLQDKSSSDLMGMIGQGYRIGEWAQLVNILESHIIGDPTFMFPGDKNNNKVDLRSNDVNYWIKVLGTDANSEIKGVALHKLFNLKYQGLPQLLVDTYNTSSSAMLRLQSYHLLQFYNDGKFEELLKKSVYDPYEFIRRKSTFSMGRVGKDEFIPYIASIYINDGLDSRVRFNAQFSFDLLDMKKLKAEVLSQIENSSSLYNKDEMRSEFTQLIDSRIRISESAKEIGDPNVKMRSRLMGVSMLRNNNYHSMVDDYLKILGDNSQDVKLKVKLAEALGWFTLSYRKGDIISACKSIAAQSGTDMKLKNELLKTANRLEEYMR